MESPKDSSVFFFFQCVCANSLSIGLTQPFLNTPTTSTALQTLPSAPSFKETPLRVQGSQSAGKRLIPSFFYFCHLLQDNLTSTMTTRTHCTLYSVRFKWHVTRGDHRPRVAFKGCLLSFLLFSWPLKRSTLSLMYLSQRSTTIIASSESIDCQLPQEQKRDE